MKAILAVDFGSTFTKVTAIDIAGREVIAAAKSFTTIETDICEGLEDALKKLHAQCGSLSFEARLASSSAAGGLKMISCGLVPDLTSNASKLAASSAGAKVLKTYSYALDRQEVEEIEALAPDIILLSGGIDGGNKDVIIRNAELLANANGNFSVIIAGNKSASDAVRSILQAGGKNAILCENVMPEFNKLNIAPAKAAIRDLFICNIIHAKGLDNAQRMMTDAIVPTPLAVFEAAELLSRGAGDEEGVGELMAYDVGGATTDVYSMSSCAPVKANVVMKGLPEPFAKRTVEGDIGVRFSLSQLIEEAGGVEAVAHFAGVSEQSVRDWHEQCQNAPDSVPESGTMEEKIDEAFAAMAVSMSANRHCGFYETAYTPFGEVLMQTGKDMSNTRAVIGTGGCVIHSKNPGEIISQCVRDDAHPYILKPIEPKILLDKKYIFYAMGLLGRIDPVAAVQMMKKEFVEV